VNGAAVPVLAGLSTSSDNTNLTQAAIGDGGFSCLPVFFRSVERWRPLWPRRSAGSEVTAASSCRQHRADTGPASHRWR
jgi:hypothetical protein